MEKLKPVKHAPVLIAGAGPVGLTLSALLSRCGVQNVIFEKNAELSQHPQVTSIYTCLISKGKSECHVASGRRVKIRYQELTKSQYRALLYYITKAHFINCRTMEIFRHAYSPNLMRRITEIVPDQSCWRHFIYATSVLNGTEIGRVDNFPSSSTSRSTAAPPLAAHQVLDRHSPAKVIHLSQSRLMPLLFDEVLAEAGDTTRSRGGKGGHVVRFGHEVKDVREVVEGVQLLVEEKETCDMHVFQGHYVVAADGSSSLIRHKAQINMLGEKGVQHLMNIHFSSRALAQATSHRPAMLYFIYNAEVVCVLVAHHYPSGEFVAQVPYFPPAQSPEDFGPVTVRALLDAAIGTAFTDLTVHSVRPWIMDCQVAQRYRSGRIFLAGDAAHRFPPAGGFGMNTGIQDAHNLSWKIASVLQNSANGALLDTYETERRPIAERNASLSMHNFSRSLRVPQALGLNVEQAKDVARISSRISNAMSKALLPSMFAVGRWPLKSLENVRHPYGEMCLAKARKILRDGASLPLLFPTEDVGFRYRPEFPRAQNADESIHHGLGLDHLQVGGRLPHIWLQCLHPDTGESLGNISSTDLADQLQAAFLSSGFFDFTRSGPFAILLSSSAEEKISLSASQTVLKGWNMPLIGVKIIMRPEVSSHSSTTTFGEFGQQDQQALFRHLIEKGGCLTLNDIEGNWEQRIHSQASSIVVRPDGHIQALLSSDKDLDIDF